jgi:basic amino acid/polyamine antiporter, APA family
VHPIQACQLRGDNAIPVIQKDNGFMNAPAKTLSPFDATAIILGVVIGAGIFKTPSLVAANSGSESMVMLLWLMGGVISFVGALCYAELTTTYPDSGGDYHYIHRAFGNRPAFLFAWARMAVIQAGSIAMISFIVGDYASEVFSLGNRSSSWYAALIILALTAVNTAGIQQGKMLQNVLTSAIVLGLLMIVFSGLALASPPAEAAHASTSFSVPGKAMIFVLLTYGGWNEAAYISAEIRQTERNMTRVLLYSIGTVTLIYLAVNFVFLKGLGLSGTANSDAVAADLMRKAMGNDGAIFISLLIVTAALSTMNAAIITGARTNYALGRDFSLFAFLGRWHGSANTPVNALLLQSAIALSLVFLGSMTRSGFSTMVEYTAPVFWFFLLLVGLSIFILRRKDPGRKRPFRVPLYPLTPVLFCAFCIYMFQSSLAYTGIGALAGVGVLAAGMPVLHLAMKHEKKILTRKGEKL